LTVKFNITDAVLKRAEAEGLNLSELSDRNLLNHYRDELLGNRIETLSSNTRANLKRQNLLNISKRGRPLRLSPRAQRLLEEAGGHE
jgi:hypothetical protein